jgi:hypothetical protein
MAYYALLDGNKVVNVLVADSVADLGEAGQLYTAVDVTHQAVRPAAGWTLENEIWYPETIAGVARSLWNGAGFDAVIEAEEEAPAIEDKKKEKSK